MIKLTLTLDLHKNQNVDQKFMNKVAIGSVFVYHKA